MSILPNSYTVVKSGDNVILPNNQSITNQQFIDRMGSMGFRQDFTAKTINDLLVDGGKWTLSMDKRQRRVLEGGNNNKVKRGFM